MKKGKSNQDQSLYSCIIFIIFINVGKIDKCHIISPTWPFQPSCFAWSKLKDIQRYTREKSSKSLQWRSRNIWYFFLKLGVTFKPLPNEFTQCWFSLSAQDTFLYFAVDMSFLNLESVATSPPRWCTGSNVFYVVQQRSVQVNQMNQFFFFW